MTMLGQTLGTMRMVREGISTLLALLFRSSAAAMQVSSTATGDRSKIWQAQVYSRCGGTNISPQLAWNGAPNETSSFIVTMIDQDVRPALWSHWIVTDLPPTTFGLERGAKVIPAGGRQIRTNFGDASFGGPCPTPAPHLQPPTNPTLALPNRTTPPPPTAHH